MDVVPVPEYTVAILYVSFVKSGDINFIIALWGSFVLAAYISSEDVRFPSAGVYGEFSSCAW